MHSNADGLPRLPLKTEERAEVVDAVNVFNMMQFEPLTITVHNVRRETHRYPVLDSFYTRRDEITVHSGCLMWGIRVIVPPKLRPQVLEELHQGHLGVVKMKALARSYIWWPGIDKEIEETAKTCSGCQRMQAEPSTAPVHPWEWPSSPWQRIHIDFAGPFLGCMFLIVVDAHSRWLEIEKMDTTTSTKTIEKLQSLFARYGVPSQLVSDNGPQFKSEEFQMFLKRNGIKHLTSAPYHPASNGLAERCVQSFKSAMKSETEVKPLSIKLATFLLAYRNTPHSTTGEAPSQLFLGGRLRTRLDLLKPDLRLKISNRQIDQTVTKGGAVTREFSIGQTVIARNYTGSTKWVPGIIRTQLGPLSYEVEVKPGLVWRRHTDQLRDTRIPVTPSSNPVTQTSEIPIQVESREDLMSVASEQPAASSQQPAASNLDTDVPPPSPVADTAACSPPNLIEPVPEPVPVRRYPVQVRKPLAKTAYFNRHVVFDLTFQTLISCHIACTS